MTLMEKFLNGINNKIETDLNEVLHEDYKFISHQNNNTSNKSEIIKLCMGNSFTNYNHRIIYENDEIGIDHAFITYLSGDTSEACLSVHVIKNGKIISTETGATSISSEVIKEL